MGKKKEEKYRPIRASELYIRPKANGKIRIVKIAEINLLFSVNRKIFQ